jgi:hypothetical protein
LFIHSWYGDLLLSTRVLFDTHIFQNRNYIKRYEFNMGNRTIQLPIDYKPNFEFPNMIVTLNDDTPSYGQRPDVAQKIPGFNLDQTPVLYNQTNGTVLLMQEEMVNIPISCTINCESQFQAKEIAALIKRWLPINKFISFLQFVSYLEVSGEFLSKASFDPVTQVISNLYTKLNKRTGEIDYCYSLQYEPFVRLDSITSAIPDSTQRSFQVVVDITYMVQQPLFMFSDIQPGTIEKIDILINPSTGFEPINDYPSSKIINYLNADITTLKKGFVRRTFLVTDVIPVETIINLDTVSLTSSQVTNISIGGRNICATKGSDDYLYITLGTSETKYKTYINTIPIPEGISIVLSVDEYIKVLKDISETITITLYKITQGLTLKFSPTDFQLTTDYSYNLISGSNILKDYTDYVLDVLNNTITFNFSNSQFSTYAPTITSPLMIQFYLENVTFPFQIGGVPPEVGLMKVFNISQTAVEMSWTSSEETITQIEYGITTSYGSVSVLNEDLTNTHHLVLIGLLPNTTYHYRIIDTLQDYTFTTLS